VLADRQLGGMFHDQLVAFSATLGEKERFLFEHRLVAEEPLTLQEVGDRYGISRERARQIEARLVQRLRAWMAEHLPDYADHVRTKPRTDRARRFRFRRSAGPRAGSLRRTRRPASAAAAPHLAAAGRAAAAAQPAVHPPGAARPRAVVHTIPFADDFERAELGPGWFSTGGHWRLVDGWLYSPGVKNNRCGCRRSSPTTSSSSST